MPGWFMCLCRWSRLHAMKEYGRDRLRYAYIPMGSRPCPEREVARNVRDARAGDIAEPIETLEPRLLFSASPVASADVFGLLQDEISVTVDVLANDTADAGGVLSLTGFTPAQSAVGDVNAGALGDDNDSGIAYLMFSTAATQSRFAGIGTAQAEHLIVVKHSGGDWLFMDYVSGSGDTWANFVPESGDLLVAQITMQAGDDAIASLEGQSFVVEGIEAGYASGDLTFIGNQWNGSYNRDEFGITGTTLTRNIRTEHGRVVDNGDGTLAYTPDADYRGADSFGYSVVDGLGGSASGAVSLSVNATVDIEAARDTLLAGVTSLADPTQPGHLVVYGPTAFSVSNYAGADLSDPMIAAATWGAGRVVALPDHQWLELGTHGSDASTATFYGNGIEWLADSAALSVKVVTYNHAGNASWLTAQGYTNVVNATSATLAAELADADVLVAGWLGTNPPEVDLDVIGDFVANQGGGLFIADYGIGYDWWWGQATQDIPGNRLLRDAGIGFVKAYPHGGGAQTINRAVGQVTADDVLSLLIDSGGATQAQNDEAAAIYTSLNGLLADSDTLQAQLDEVFWARIGSINPMPSTPVSDSFEQALLQREMDLIQNLTPDEVTAHRTAEDVYGAIPANAPRLTNQSVTIDANTTGLIATGLYAVPGELVTVTLPAAMVGQGYTLRINNHVDNITGHSSYARVPYGVSRSFAIDSTTIQIANAFGGQIYIDMGGQAGGTSSGLGSQQITIDGAIAAPMFILGLTTDADWVSTIRDNPAPYAEFVSEHLAFSVPSDWTRTLDNPTQLMQFWDDAVSRMDYIAGTESLRTGPERINLDVAISAGLLHAGNPIQGPTSYGPSIVNYEALTSGGDWGWFHELGHEIQRQTALGWGYDNPWTFGGDVEVTVNIFANAALEHMTPSPGILGSSTSGWAWSARPEEVMARAMATINDVSAPSFDQKDPYPFYFQLADGFGWDTYRAVLSSYVDDAQNDPGALPQDNQQEKDQWLTRWSQETGYNLVDYMVNKWGLEVSQGAIDTVNALSLPSWLPVVPNDTTHRVAHASSIIIDPATAGLSLDGTATFVSIAATSAQGGTITLNGNGTYTYAPDLNFVGIDQVEVTYQSSEGNTVTTALNIEVFELAANPDKAQWSLVSVDSEETVGENGGAINAFDGDPNTLWHTQWNGGSPTHPHELVLDLGGRYALDAFTYTPRQSGTNGRIANYEFYVSNDGINWGSAVASGTFANNANAQSASFTTTTGRYIKLVALSEVNGNPWTTVAELDVSGTLAAPDANDWELVSFDSEETVGENGAVINAFDGNPNTIWHTQWYGGSPAHPHELALDLGARFDLDGFTYQARQTGTNGRIADYEFYVSADGINWGSAVATGTFTNTSAAQTVSFAKTTGQFIKLVALSEVNGNAWTSVAELGVTGVFAAAGEVAPVALNDSVDVLLNQATVIDALTNDYDVDRGDAMTIASFTQGTSGGGSVADNGDGTLTYTPANNYIGSDSFTYTVTDSTGRSATASVSLTIAGLVSQWAFDEGTGNTASDAGLNNATGTITNATWAPGVHGSALEFNGSDSVVNLGNAPALSGTTDFTLAAWINTTDTNGGTILQQRDATGGGWQGQYRFRMNADGTLNFFIYNNGYQFNFSTSQAVNDGLWHHVIAQRDGLGGRLYIDGVLAASATGSEIKQLNSNIAVAIGANIRDNDDFFKGTIDDVQLHNRTLDAAEIAAIYQAMPNLAPIANTDLLTVVVDTAATIDVLANDGDHNTADTLSILSFSQGTSGVVADNGDGTLIYTPNASVGSTDAQIDTFTYTTTDGQGESSTATVIVTIGDAMRPTDFNTTGGTAQVTATGNHQYELNIDFTNAQSTIDHLWIDWGNGIISHGTAPGGWGQDLTSTTTNLWTATQHVYDPTHVQHIQVFAVGINGNTYQSHVTLDATQIPVYNLSAEVLSQSEVRLSWAHRLLADAPFNVSISSDGGQTFVHAMTTALGATFALVDSLAPDTTYQYRVEAALGQAIAFTQPPLDVALQQPPAAIGQPGFGLGWYRVAVETPALQHGSAGYTGSGTATVIGNNTVVANDANGIARTWELVIAASEEAAIYQAIQASAYITANDIQQSKIFTFGNDAAFKVGTFGDLNNDIPGYNITANPGDDQYLITLEDTFQWTNIDLDFDDWYWEVLVEQVQPSELGPSIDLDVDSDNQDGFTPPIDNLHEDQIEVDPSRGKWIAATTGDVDEDGIQDYADFAGIAGWQFVPLVIRLSSDLVISDLALVNIQFDYDAVSPLFFGDGDGLENSELGGKLRIWTKDAFEARVLADYIGAGEVVTAADLGLTLGGSVVLYVEAVGAQPGQQALPISVSIDIPGEGTYQDLVHVRPVAVDLDIDSLNDSAFNLPDQNIPEDLIEGNNTQGKFIDVGTLSVDNDLIPDFADGFNAFGDMPESALSVGDQFVPIVVRLPDLVDPALVRLSFEYSASDPAGISRTGDGTSASPYIFTAAPGHLRLWSKDGGLPRHVVADYVASGTSYSTLDFVGGNGFVVLWVEAVHADSGQDPQQIIVTLSYPAFGDEVNVTDVVTLLVQDPEQAAVDLDIDSDNLGGLNRNNDEEAVEDVSGKITALSIQDIDGNSIPDFADMHGIAGLEFAELALEINPPQSQVTYLGGGEYSEQQIAREALLDGAMITFTYDDSDPSLVTGGNHDEQFDPYLPQDGLLRLWRKNGSSDRLQSDFIVSGQVYSGAELGIDYSGLLSLWVEAVNSNGDNIEIQVHVEFGQTPAAYTSSNPGGGSSGSGTVPDPTATPISADDVVYVRPGGVDLDIDSDNNGETASGTLAEDVLEDVGVGKVLVVATSDRDGNGTLDFTDGFDGAAGVTDAHLVALDLGLPDWITSGLASVTGTPWVVFNYAASDPIGLGGSAGASQGEVALPPGNLRLWTADQVRQGISAAGGASGPLGAGVGRFVQDAQVEMNSITLKFGESIDKNIFQDKRIYLSDLLTQDNTLRLFVEAISPPEDGQPITIEVIFGTTLDLNDPTRERDVVVGADSVRVTVVEPMAPFADGIGLNQVGDGLDGGSPRWDAFLGPIRVDGQLASLVAPELSGDPFAWAFGHNRVWSNDPVAGIGALAGPGQMVADLPFLVHGTSTMIAVFSPTNQLYFDRIENNDTTPDTYKIRFFAHDKLVVKTDNTIELIDSAGNSFLFFGYDDQGPNAVHDLQKGKLQKITTASGHEIDFTYNANTGLLEESIREIGGGIQEKLTYEYTAAIQINDRANFYNDDARPILYQPTLKTVKLIRVDGAEETVTRSVVYDYYTGDEVALPSGTQPGRMGDLKTATVMIHHNGVALGVEIEQTYYRYEYNADGWSKPILSQADLPLTQLIVIDPAALSRAKGSGIFDLNTISTNDLVDLHGATRIHTHHSSYYPGFTTRGLSANTSAAGGAIPDSSIVGTGGYFLENVERHDVIGPNAVRYTINVSTDGVLVGPTEFYELNAAREVLSHMIQTDEGDWITRFTYDTQGRLLSSSSPSGLTTRYDYFTGDPLTDPKAGRLERISLQDDPDNPTRSTPLTEFDYAAFEGLMRLESITEHIDPNTNTTAVTNIAYTGPNGTATRTTTLPDTTATGGQPASFTESFDTQGNITSLTDANNIHHTSAYDANTLTLTEVVDAGGLNLTTLTHFDELGNVTYVEHADSTRTYFHIYQDESEITITSQSGWYLTNGAYTTQDNVTQTTTRLDTGEVSSFVWVPQGTSAPTNYADFSQGFQGAMGIMVRGTVTVLDIGGRAISSVTAGAGITQSPLSIYEYDDHGRLNKTHQYYSDTGYITQETQFDTLGRVTEIFTAGNLIQSFEYDGGDPDGDGQVNIGDSNITQTTSQPGNGAEDRVTLNIFDWRNRLVASKQGHQGGIGESNINRPGAIYFYDNLDQLIQTEVYDADGDTPVYDLASDTVSWTSDTNQQAYLQITSYTEFDTRGQVYQTRAVDPLTNYEVIANLWYDAQGQVIKEVAPGGLTTKITYDSAGRATDIFLTDDASGGTTTNGDNVLEHTQTTYDESGNATYIHTTLRTAYGGTRNESVSNFYDELGRLTTTLNHGTNVPTGDVRPDEIDPLFSRAMASTFDGNDTFLRTDFEYSTDGLTVTITDPRGIDSSETYDAQGRIVEQVEANGRFAAVRDEGYIESVSGTGTESSQPIERWTNFEYDGLGRIVNQTVDTPTDSPKITTYLYGGLYLNTIQLPGYAEAAANSDDNKLVQTQYLSYSHNALGEIKNQSAPANGTTKYHYTRDVLGRVTEERASFSIQSIQTVITDDVTKRLYQYDTLGNITKITAVDDNGTEKSVVNRIYNAFGQLTFEGQDHSPGGWQKEYTYSYANVNGGVRATGYSDDTVSVGYAYNVGIDSDISRISGVSFNGAEIENYLYLGLSTPERIGGGELDEIRTFDAFGRLESQQWWRGVLVGHFSYRYDSNGNLLSKQDHVNNDQSELFHIDGYSTAIAYDGLNRLQYYQRGQLTREYSSPPPTGQPDPRRFNAIANTALSTEDWDADTTGVHRSVESASETLQNQTDTRPFFQGDFDISKLETLLNNWVGSDASPPLVLTARFDAWGHLVERKNWAVTDWWFDNEDPVLQTTRTYRYDGLGRLIQRKTVEAATGGDNTTWGFSHDAAGNIIEEVIHDTSGSPWVLKERKHIVWSPVTGQVILQKRDDNADGTFDQTLFALVDGRGNVVGLVDEDVPLAVATWYDYTPSGESVRRGAYQAFAFRFGQGWYDNDQMTITRSGFHYDALTNGVLKISPGQYWGYVAATPELPWYVRVGASIAEDPWYALNETGHLVLDVVGFVPGIGIVADGVNAIWYLAEGRELEAAISGFAAIPGIGYLGAGAQLGKYTGRIAKGARFVSEAVTGIRRGGRLYDVSRVADIGLNVGVSAYFGVQGYHNNNPLQVGLSVTGLGINGIAIARWGRVGNANRTASVGTSNSTNYRRTFFDANPGTEGKVVVHHAVEQQILKRYPGRFTASEIHSLENLRGISKSINSSVHLSQIRKVWNGFYKSNKNATRQQILDEATRIDKIFGKQFNPPL